MVIEVSESVLVDELAVTLRRFGYSVVRKGSHSLDVASDAERERAVHVLDSAELEIDAYLRAWEARFPGTRVVRVA